MAGLLSPKAGGQPDEEWKLIPALDIKVLESVDSLTFSIILHDDCLLNDYNEETVKPNKKKNRTSSIISFGLLGKGGEDDGGFPMAFESEHVTSIVAAFRKLQ